MYISAGTAGALRKNSREGEAAVLNAMIIDRRDNVAVAIEPIEKGGLAVYALEGQNAALTAAEDITIYHKIAVRDIPKGEAVVKYGEHIGVAARDIRAGEHVHVHNVEERRENLGDRARGGN